MQYPTHEVINQPPPLEGHNAFTLDLALGEALAREGAAWAADSLEELGEVAGTAEAIEWGRLANVNPPVLHTHDRFGHREDRIDFHPAYHQLMGIAIAAGLNAAPWADSRPGSHVVRPPSSSCGPRSSRGTLLHVDDLRRGAHPGRGPRPAGRVAAPASPRRTTTRPSPRPHASAGPSPGVASPRARRVRRAGQHHHRRARRRRRFLLTGAVLRLGDDRRCLPRPRPGARRSLLLPLATVEARQLEERHIDPAPRRIGGRSNACRPVEFFQGLGLPSPDEGRGVRTMVGWSDPRPPRLLAGLSG